MGEHRSRRQRKKDHERDYDVIMLDLRRSWADPGWVYPLREERDPSSWEKLYAKFLAKFAPFRARFRHILAC